MRLTRVSTGPDGEPRVDVRVTADDVERLRRWAAQAKALGTAWSAEDAALVEDLAGLQRDLFAEMDAKDVTDAIERDEQLADRLADETQR